MEDSIIFYKMRLVNANFHGRVSSLNAIHWDDYVLLHATKPRLLKKTIPDKGIILLFPSSGKFRAMGGNMTPLTVQENIPVDADGVRFQGATFTGSASKRLNLIHLHHLLTTSYKCFYEPELFNALTIYLPDNGGIVNFFASGKYVAMGSAPTSKFIYYICKILTINKHATTTTREHHPL